MAAMEDIRLVCTIELNFHVSIWQALKMRLAGADIMREYFKQQMKIDNEVKSISDLLDEKLGILSSGA